MEKLYKCEYTGKIFDNELDCIESEYINSEEHQKFVDLIHSFIEKIENRFNIKVNKGTLKINDEKENYYNDRIIHRRYVKFSFVLNNEVREYFRTSDSVGDGRWEWGIKDDVDSLMYDFEREFILPLRKSFTGKLHYVCNDDYYQEGYWKLGSRDLEDILKIFSRKKKTIKIEIIN